MKPPAEAGFLIQGGIVHYFLHGIFDCDPPCIIDVIKCLGEWVRSWMPAAGKRRGPEKPAAVCISKSLR